MQPVKKPSAVQQHIRRSLEEAGNEAMLKLAGVGIRLHVLLTLRQT